MLSASCALYVVRRKTSTLFSLQQAGQAKAYATRMLKCLDQEESREIREFLRESGYNTQALKARFGHTEIPHVHLLKLYLVGIAMEPSRLNILFQWFWIG